jgi:uncharacterized protein (DUF2267 family)
MANKDHFHTMVSKSEAWIKVLEHQLGCDEHHALSILRSVLHTLRDRMPIEHVAQLGAQLPTLIRGVYYEGWTPHGKPVKIRHKEDFLDDVWIQLSKPADLNVEAATRTAFEVLYEKLSEGEMFKIAQVLPAHVRELLPRQVTAS